MPRYSDQRKEAVLRKVLPPHNRLLGELAAAEGISEATLYNWRRATRDQGPDGVAEAGAAGGLYHQNLLRSQTYVSTQTVPVMALNASVASHPKLPFPHRFGITDDDKQHQNNYRRRRDQRIFSAQFLDNHVLS